jgi:hypothetical protein
MWRGRNVAFESNIIEMTRRRISAWHTGIHISGSPPPRPILRLAVRDNILRHFQDLPDPDRVVGVSATGTERAIVHGNVIGLAGANQDEHTRLLPYAQMDR